jgi:hypothetical protein
VVVSKIALLDEKLFLAVCSSSPLPGDAAARRLASLGHWRRALVRVLQGFLDSDNLCASPAVRAGLSACAADAGICCAHAAAAMHVLPLGTLCCRRSWPAWAAGTGRFCCRFACFACTAASQ